MGIAVALKRQHRPLGAIAMNARRQPNLARAALHLVALRAVPLIERRKAASKLDDIAVAVVPLLEHRKVVDDLVYCHGLVSRFRSSQTFAASSDANFGIKGTLATLRF